MVKKPPANARVIIWFPSLRWAWAHSSILAWRFPKTEESSMLQFIGSQRVGHNWNNLAHTCMNLFILGILGVKYGSCSCHYCKLLSGKELNQILKNESSVLLGGKFWDQYYFIGPTDLCSGTCLVLFSFCSHNKKGLWVQENRKINIEM